MKFSQYITHSIHLVVIRIMGLTGGVKFAMHFMSTAKQPNHRPKRIYANGREMTFGEDYYWYTDWKGHLFLLAKW